MSWIFTILLIGYGFARAWWWFRGQVRYRQLQGGLPQVPALREPPRHLIAEHADVFRAADTTRRTLIHHLRVIKSLQLTDPDAVLGHLRHPGYRRAVMQAWSALVAWERLGLPLVGPLRSKELESLGLQTSRCRELHDRLHPYWREVCRARPLELFPLTRVREVEMILDEIVLELHRVLSALAVRASNPYRDVREAGVLENAELKGSPA